MNGCLTPHKTVAAGEDLKVRGVVGRIDKKKAALLGQPFVRMISSFDYLFASAFFFASSAALAFAANHSRGKDDGLSIGSP